MALVEIPSLGESVSEGVIARWLKKNGDQVVVDEVILELETDKAALEISASASGALEILKPEGSKASVGEAVVWYVHHRGSIIISCFVPADAA